MRTTAGQRGALEAFLSRPSRPSGTLSYGELEGFLFALACAPELVRPSEWLPRIFGGDSPDFASEREAQQILGALMALYNEVNDDVRNGAARLSGERVFREDLLANLEPDAPISAWARGFADGHLWLEESWDEYLLEEWEDEFGAFLATLTFFSSPSYAKGFVDELTEGTSVEKIGATFRELFPDAVRGYAGMGQAIWQARLEMESEVEPHPPAPPTAGRNQPCPCGSGRKFKRCCGGVMH